MINLLVNTDLAIALTCFSLICFAVWDSLRRHLDHEREDQQQECEPPPIRINPYLYSEKIWPDDELWPEGKKGTEV
jgi:hypothetical protein